MQCNVLRYPVFHKLFFFSLSDEMEREREREECAMCTMVDGTKKKGQGV